MLFSGVAPMRADRVVKAAPARRAGVLRRLLADRAGGVLTEYAFIAPPFIALLLAIIHTSLVFLAQEGLETAAESAARLIMTGTAQNGSYTASSFKTAACNSLPKFLVCSRLYIDVSTISSYSGTPTSTPTFTYSNGNVSNSFSYTPGTQGAIVVLRLMYLWPTANGPFGFTMINQQGSNHLIVATSVLKTEGY